jgi:prophage DNA circulation protein
MSDLGIGPWLQLVGSARRIDATGADWLNSSWYQQLQPGSWRGVGFVMDAAETKAGRRTALHEYPYRDTVWVEDLGRLPRRFSFQAFIVGDDVYQQRDQMIAACEQAGEGTLVHPTLGTVQCVLIDFTTTDRRERGRMVEVAFTFVVSGDIRFPDTVMATGANVDALAGALNITSAGQLAGTLQTLGGPIPHLATANVPGFAGLAVGVVNDPTRALNAVRGLAGDFGRYATGKLGNLQPITATVASALSDSVTSRAGVLAAASQLQAAARGL